MIERKTGSMIERKTGSMNIFRFICKAIILGIYDVTNYLIEIPKVFFSKKINHESLLIKINQKKISHLSIIVSHPNKELDFSSINLINSLINKKYTVVVATNHKGARTQAHLICSDIHVVDRNEWGRDFGAWKSIFVALLNNDDIKKSLKSVIIANESMFYNKKGADKIIECIDKSGKHWSCLSENYDIHYHAQSYFLHFGPDVINSREFKKFWEGYLPFSSRRHSINAGEVGLSKILVRTFGKPFCLYSSVLISRAVESIEIDRLAEMAERLSCSLHCHPGIAELINEIYFVLGESEFSCNVLHQKKLPVITRKKKMLSIIVGNLCEQKIPSHSIGLLLNYLFLSPIKKDICLKGFNDISFVIRYASGYSEDELALMELGLRDRGLSVSYRGIKKILLNADRI